MTTTEGLNRQDARSRLPDGWRCVKLGEAIVEAQHGFAIGERDQEGVIQLRMNNVTTQGQFDWSSFIRVPADSETIAAYRLQSGDVLFNNTNSTELVGKTALFEGHDEPVVFSNHFTRIRTNTEKLDSRFLAFWLQQQWQRSVFANICNRWIGQSAVQREKLLALEIPLPPLAKQKRIVAILQEQMAPVKEARRSAEAQLQAAEALPAAYLRAVFSSPEAHAWPKRNLGDVAVLERGKFTPRPRNDPRYFGGPYNWIQIGEVEAAHKYILEHRGTLNELGLSVSKMFPKGTLVISIAASIGAVGILGFDSCMPDSLVGITPRAGLSDSEYLYYWLSFTREHLESIAPQMAQANLKLEMLNPLELPIPPLAVQHRIGAQLSAQMASAERLRQTLADHLDTINKLPAALLREAFSGKL